MKTLIIALSAASVALAAPAAAAQESVTVEHRDLDLNTADGQATLKQRLDTAARQVCGMDRKTTGTRIRSREAAQCYAEAKSQAKERFASLVEGTRLGG